MTNVFADFQRVLLSTIEDLATRGELPAGLDLRRIDSSSLDEAVQHLGDEVAAPDRGERAGLVRSARGSSRLRRGRPEIASLRSPG